MGKISLYPQDSAPATTDYLLGNDGSGPTTKRFSLSSLISLFWTLANIPTGATSPITRDNESMQAYVASGGVWTADSAGVNRNASMTAMICYINGRRISIAAVTARTFTASVDTYIDVLDNGDGTGTLVYTTAVNNAASAALASNSLRIGIIVTGATTIAAATSINQGQETMLLPIASSTPYAVVDSLGNLICPRDPDRTTLALRQATASQNFNATPADATGLTFTCIVPTARKIRLEFSNRSFLSSIANDNLGVTIQEGSTVLMQTEFAATGTAGNANSRGDTSIEFTPSAGSHTYKVALVRTAGSGTCSMLAASDRPAQFRALLA